MMKSSRQDDINDFQNIAIFLGLILFCAWAFIPEFQVAVAEILGIIF